MGIFSFLKKEPNYDPTNIKVTDLDVGFVFEYDLSTWVVKERYYYDWGHNSITQEFKVSNGKDVKYLSVENDDELNLLWTSKVKIRQIDEDLPEYIQSNEQPPKKLIFEGVTYFLDSESPGYFIEGEMSKKDEDWDELISWDYFDESEKLYLNIEQWGEREFEASAGKSLKEFEISNILPQS